MRKLVANILPLAMPTPMLLRMPIASAFSRKPAYIWMKWRSAEEVGDRRLMSQQGKGVYVCCYSAFMFIRGTWGHDEVPYWPAVVIEITVVALLRHEAGRFLQPSRGPTRTEAQ
jgi:hypothetical protein